MIFLQASNWQQRSVLLAGKLASSPTMMNVAKFSLKYYKPYTAIDCGSLTVQLSYIEKRTLLRKYETAKQN